MRRRFRSLLYSTWHWAKRDGVNRAVEQLQHNQWCSAADLSQLQSVKLTKLLSFAYQYVPYYRHLLREYDIPLGPRVDREDFRRLPVLTKEVIRLQRQALVSENLTGNALVENSTSGSTGEATRFFTDLRSLAFRRASSYRSDAWTGWRRGERTVRIWGAAIDRKRATDFRGTLHGWITGNRLLSSFDMSSSKMDEYIATIRAFHPSLLIAYPGPLEHFTLHCRKRKCRFPSLKGIVTSAETLWPQQRQIVEETLETKIFNRYGCREFGQIASECETHEGLHVSTDRLLVEILDNDGHPCVPGAPGRVLVTDLDNFGMPMIRYEIGDRAAWAPVADCSCGRGLPLLQQVEGRTLDIVRTPDGRQIGGTFWTLLLRSRPSLRQFQVVQDRLGGVVINFIRDSDFDCATLEYFTSRIKEYCGDDFDVDYVEQEHIDLTTSGKQRLIVSRLTNSERT